MGKNVHECILKYIFQIILISYVSCTDTSKAFSIMGIKIPGRSLIALLQPF